MTMTTTVQLLEEVKRRYGLTSDYQLARRLRIEPSRICHYMAGRRFLGDEIALRVADELGVDRGAVLATVAAERSDDGDTRKALLALVKRAGGLALAVATLFLGTPPPPAAAAVVRCDVGPVYYVKSRRRRPTAKRRARWTDAVRRHLRRISANSLTWAARRIAAAALLVPLAATAGEPWSATERALGVAAGTALALDWLQTRYIALHPGAFNEHNPILGEHPSPGAVNVYFAGAALGGYLAADVLPAHWRRAFLAGGLVVELAVIRHNARLGIGLAF